MKPKKSFAIEKDKKLSFFLKNKFKEKCVSLIISKNNNKLSSNSVNWCEEIFRGSAITLSFFLKVF